MQIGTMSSKAKYIAMIDVFIFILLIMFFFYYDKVQKLEDQIGGIPEFRSHIGDLEERNAILLQLLEEAFEDLKKSKQRSTVLEEELRDTDEIRQALSRRIAMLLRQLRLLEEKLAANNTRTKKIAAEEADLKDQLREALRKIAWLEDNKKELLSQGGNFIPSKVNFDAAHFASNPVLKLVDTNKTDRVIGKILTEYRRYKEKKYKYIFIVGHANQMGKEGEKQTIEERRAFNWLVAARRASLIAARISEKMEEEGTLAANLDDIILASTGELDLVNKDNPISQENAWVEVFFGRDWKLR